eukprot:snap_masked-scaffold_10-processed-gene-2.37-mRNA-1 protein AED:1.00 eAED:1.00 QI:0/0/0/0/1/1/2/0/189
MSFFHKTPSYEKLRNKIIEKTHYYFENKLGRSFSIHEVQAIILPDKRPMKNFPVSNNIYNELNKNCSVPFNLFFFVDDCFYGGVTMENRLNYVRSCFVILDDGFIIYKREIKNLFYREFVGCIDSVLYYPRKEEIEFYSWKDIEIFVDEEEIEKEVVKVFFGRFCIYCKISTFETLIKFKKKWKEYSNL